MNKVYVGQGYVVSGDSRCIVVRRFEDVTESVPDTPSLESDRIPAILTWMQTPAPYIPMPWPLPGSGIIRMGQQYFDLELLPPLSVDATQCRAKVIEAGSCGHILVLELPQTTVLLAKRAHETTEVCDLFAQYA